MFTSTLVFTCAAIRYVCTLTVIGAIIGKQDGRHLEVLNSFELVYTVVGDDLIIDKDYYRTKEEQCK